LKEVLEAAEKELIATELRWTRGNLARAASNLGVSERVMRLRAVKYGLKNNYESS
jgi:Nif-specific regulatory protein